jgi:uncharacterized protein (DUF1501 family)
MDPMDDRLDQLISRRSFLRRGSCAALGLAGLSSQLLTMRSVHAALDGATFGDYRALVCIFLYGGNDSGNTVIPYDGGDQNLAEYQAQRAGLALSASDVAQTIIAPSNTSGRRFALHPSMSGLKALFDAGDLAIVANTGTLLFPMTRHEFRNKLVPAPPQLMAHNWQQEQWQLSRPDALDGVGWGGRLADMLQANGANPDSNVSMSISIAGTSRFLNGKLVTPYSVGRDGPATLNTGSMVGWQDRDEARAAMLDLLAVQDDPTHPGSSAMGKVLADVTRRAVHTSDFIDGLLEQGTAIATPIPTDNSLAEQLAMVARLIEFGQSGLSHERQVFFCSMGGFDNHSGLIGATAADGPHADLLRRVNDALVYFHTALGEIGRRDSVTTFTASDFGRTFESNGNGSDHGWGAPHLVMGGSQVDGGKMYGTFPNILIAGPDDSGDRGTFIPTTSVDAYGFELARWMGVPLSDMSTVFPHISRFLDIHNPSTHLGFMGA